MRARYVKREGDDGVGLKYPQKEIASTGDEADADWPPLTRFLMKRHRKRNFSNTLF